MLAWVALLVGAASPVAAECTRFDAWPSFREAARTADRIVVGEVLETYRVASGGTTITYVVAPGDDTLFFDLRVIEVLRGRSDPVLEFREPVRSGAPLKFCRDSHLFAHAGDLIAFAFDARVADFPKPVLAVAWLSGTLDPFTMPGVERMTIEDVRVLAGAPATDIVDPDPIPARSVPVMPLLVASLLGAIAFLFRSRPPDG
jgi:hypothetical protein